MISIYQYTDPCPYLRDQYEERKRKNASFSIRSWAKMLQLKHHNSLFEMLNGKRKISPKIIPNLIKNLKLDRNEAAYLYQLTNLQRSKSMEEKEIILEKISSMTKEKKLPAKLIDSFKMLQDPIHIIITELSSLKDFSSDPKWIKKKLGFNTSIQEIEAVIERLISFGLMKRDENGNLVKTNEHTYTKCDVLDLGIQAYHVSVMNLASKAIKNQLLEDREYNAFCVNIQKHRLPEIKKFIRDFTFDFIAEFEAKNGTGTDTYQLNTQFFNLTDKIE